MAEQTLVIHTMENYTGIKKKKKSTDTWMKLKILMLSERAKKKKKILFESAYGKF